MPSKHIFWKMSRHVEAAGAGGQPLCHQMTHGGGVCVKNRSKKCHELFERPLIVMINVDVAVVFGWGR